MSLLNDTVLQTIAAAFEERPNVPDDKLPPLLNSNQGQCEFCKKFTPLISMPVIDTGIVKAQEPLCAECLPTFKDQARVVCTNCKVVVLWVDPHKEDTGFEFKRSHVYHVNKCPKCLPGTKQTQVLEKLIYYKENKIPHE